MRLLILILLLFTATAYGQSTPSTPTPTSNANTLITNRGASYDMRATFLPNGWYPWSAYRKYGAIWFDSSNTRKVWYHNGVDSLQLTDKVYVDSLVNAGGGGGNADSATFFTNYRGDTMRDNIYAAINNVGNPDTLIYSTRNWRQKGIDSVMLTVNGFLSNYVLLTDSNNVYLTAWRTRKAIDSVAGLIPTPFDSTHIYAALSDSMGVVRDSLTAIRGDIPDVSGFATQAGLNDTAGDLRTDINTKQLAGNYITGLTGDVTASGPGSATATLATVNATPATYGGASAIPIVAVNAKGLVTSITTVAPATAGTVTSIQIVGGTGATVTPTTAVTTSGVYTVTPTVSENTTNTLTNKRWVGRGGTTTSSATPTINTDNFDFFTITALTTDITSMTTNLTGTPNNGDVFVFEITGTATRAIAWGSMFAGPKLPTTTVSTTTLGVILRYSTTNSLGNNKWICTGTY